MSWVQQRTLKCTRRPFFFVLQQQLGGKQREAENSAKVENSLKHGWILTEIHLLEP